MDQAFLIPAVNDSVFLLEPKDKAYEDAMGEMMERIKHGQTLKPAGSRVRVWFTLSRAFCFVDFLSTDMFDTFYNFQF